MIIILKIYIIYVHFKYVKRVLPESLERKYFSVHIAIFYKFAFHSCKFFKKEKMRHDIFLPNALF